MTSTDNGDNGRAPAATCALLLLLLAWLGATGAATASAPALFVFGDSLVDDGNNNELSCIAKANYYPYGIDFPQGAATGRFCNGKTVVDALCDLLGLAYLPPYTTAGLNGTASLGGVNYASAAGGILDETGQHLGDRFSLNQQLLNFQSNLDVLKAQIGEETRYSQYLARSVAVMVLGSNDYINNYLLPSLYTSSYDYSPEYYADLLINHYTRQILALYSVRLRKFLLAGVGPLGCFPSQRASGAASPPGRCADPVNRMVGFFNQGLRSLVDQLNTDHPSAVFVYGNTYGVIQDMLTNPATYGFTVVDSGCCGVGQKNRGEVTCLPDAEPCPNRDQYVFWDARVPSYAGCQPRPRPEGI